MRRALTNTSMPFGILQLIVAHCSAVSGMNVYAIKGPMPPADLLGDEQYSRRFEELKKEGRLNHIVTEQGHEDHSLFWKAWRDLGSDKMDVSFT